MYILGDCYKCTVECTSSQSSVHLVVKPVQYRTGVHVYSRTSGWSTAESVQMINKIDQLSTQSNST